MLYRRRFLQSAALSPGVAMLPASAAPPAGGAPLRLLQPLDPSADQQEQVRDHAAGLQLAVQGVNQAGGIGGREVQVQSLPVTPDGAGVHSLQQRLRADSGLLGLAGCTSERLSLVVVEALLRSDPGVAHVAPWMHDGRHDAAPQVLNLFASRDQQVRHTLASLHEMGLRQLAVVYDGEDSRATVQRSLDAALQQLSLRPPLWVATDGVESLARRLPPDTPPVLAFVGGTLELARFVQALSARSMTRYVVSLADADLGLLTQLGATRAMPLVLTQVVPNPRSAAVPLARLFRERYAVLYDDTPSPAGLAGYVAGRYLLRLLDRVGPQATRAALLEQVRRRPEADIEGHPLRFGNGRSRGSAFVTQTLITRDGRLIG